MSENDFPVAYRVVTGRMLIRCWSPLDAILRRAALDDSDQHLRPWIPYMKDEPQSVEETAGWLRRMRAAFDLDQEYRYGIFSPDETRLIGETGLYKRVGAGAREIGYWVARDAGGCGYATEASAAMLRVAFEIDRVDRVEIHCAPENTASTLIPKKLGFTHEATLGRRYRDSEGDIHDTMMFTMFANQYPGAGVLCPDLSAYDSIGRQIL
jgi:RimJ/RimL family protein N-acetyltransferase